ncbi:VOC family protein [Nonomuraea sp. NPDC000554]|uniref:VOC family protein n=1 Tax=Nonomuraea sp. NPDC000554 TaxID=3154259 RepID=UPI003333756E
MALGISQVALYVDDQQKAVDFWVGKVGCTVTRDLPYGQDRWIEIEPPGDGARMAIMKAGPGWPKLDTDRPNYVLFHADDIVKAHEELSARGVEFTQPPKQEHWGWSAVFKDDEGNLFHLGQR